MADTPVRGLTEAGLTLTLFLYSEAGAATILNNSPSGDAAPEGAAGGLYTATVSEALAGWHYAVLVDGADEVWLQGYVYLADTTEPCVIGGRVGDLAEAGGGGGGGGDATAANQTAILAAIADVPTVDEFNARTLPVADYFDPVNHPVVLADNAITAAKIATGAFTAAKFAADAINAIQAGLASAAAVSGITSVLSGITSLANWLRLLARKDAAIGTDAAIELAEINADGGSGAGEFTQVTDSQQAIRDRVNSSTGSTSSTINSGLTRQSFFSNPTQKRRIVQNDDYLLDERPLRFEDDGSWGLTEDQINNLTALKFTAKQGTETIAKVITEDIGDSILSDGAVDPVLIAVPLTHDETNVAVGDYSYDLQLTLDSGSVWTVELGTLEIVDDVTDPN